MSPLRLQFVLAVALVACSASFSYSQTQATCTFNLFDAPGYVGGVNDFRTTVGQSTSNGELAFIRYAGGAVSYFSAPNAAGTTLTAINDGGVSVGYYAVKGASVAAGLILQGSTFASFTHPGATLGTQLTGVNKYKSAVGWYLDSAYISHGFIRSSNGGLVSLNYPGSSQGTTALGINDFGTVVGSFGSFDGSTGGHGYLYHAGTWAQVDYPSSNPGTSLAGISNTNVAIGSYQSGDTYIPFLYANGVFETISVPNAESTQVTGISANGVISGNAAYSDGSTKSFTANCK